MTATRIIIGFAMLVAMLAGFWFAFRGVRKYPHNDNQADNHPDVHL